MIDLAFLHVWANVYTEALVSYYAHHLWV